MGNVYYSISLASRVRLAFFRLVLPRAAFERWCRRNHISVRVWQR